MKWIVRLTVRWVALGAAQADAWLDCLTLVVGWLGGMDEGSAFSVGADVLLGSADAVSGASGPAAVTDAK